MTKTISFQEWCQRGFLSPWVQRENYPWPDGKKLNHPDVNNGSQLSVTRKKN